MTNRELKDVLLKFRTGEVNILIATNVVEEGLDVSECNLVICMNEMMNVKAFIQMKGRARKKDSNFIFLSAN
jgi:ERCC4-related helicase